MTKPYQALVSFLAALCLLALQAPALGQQSFVWAPDFPVGSTVAPIAAPDQDGTIRSFDDLVGENGLLLMFSRSFDW